MVRNDFVSNSSSSSFIVSNEDNKFDILLQDYQTLTLEEYVKHYIREDLFHYSFEFKKEDIKYVSEAVFSKKFATGIINTFPLSAKNSVEAYLTLSNNRPKGTWDSDNIRKWNENLDAIFETIKSKILEALKPEWKNVKFHCSEVDDNPLWYDKDGNEIERDDMVDTMEELVEERINYMNSLKPLKFYRTFCHH